RRRWPTTRPSTSAARAAPPSSPTPWSARWRGGSPWPMAERALNRRSAVVTTGPERAPNRAMLRAVGFTDEDFGKPIVGIADGHSTITPCNAGLRRLAEAAAEAVRAAGGMPQTFGTITVSDGISMGTEGMKCSLVSREVIADSIETVGRGQSMDAMVVVGGCDKNMPGGMIA